MRIEDGIAYADEQPPEPVIVAVRALAGHRLELTLGGGAKRVFDMSPFLRHAVYAPVADESVFSQVRLEGGAPTWLGGRVDFAPETLIARSVPMR